jgi:hypothetical protein
MSEHMFLVRRGKLTSLEVEQRERIAKFHGIAFVYANIPGTGWQSWFSGPNRGAPFDDALARTVALDVRDLTHDPIVDGIMHRMERAGCFRPRYEPPAELEGEEVSDA